MNRTAPACKVGVLKPKSGRLRQRFIKRAY